MWNELGCAEMLCTNRIQLLRFTTAENSQILGDQLNIGHIVSNIIIRFLLIRAVFNERSQTLRIQQFGQAVHRISLILRIRLVDLEQIVHGTRPTILFVGIEFFAFQSIPDLCNQRRKVVAVIDFAFVSLAVCFIELIEVVRCIHGTINKQHQFDECLVELLTAVDTADHGLFCVQLNALKFSIQIHSCNLCGRLAHHLCNSCHFSFRLTRFHAALRVANCHLDAFQSHIFKNCVHNHFL